MQSQASYLSRIRGVALLPDERVAAILDIEQGLLEEPASSGRLLVATNRRLINVADDGRTRATGMYALGSVSRVSLREEARRRLSWKYWALIIIGGMIAYALLAYWLVDRLPSVIIPVLNLHAFALVVVALVALPIWLLWRRWTEGGGRRLEITGVDWEIKTECGANYGDLLTFANILLLLQSAAVGEGSVRTPERE